LIGLSNYRWILPQIFLYLSLAVSFLFGRPASAQTRIPEAQAHDWDFGVWAAAETGEELTNSFSEAQIITAGLSAGKILTNEIGSGWRRGRFEYEVSLVPLFYQARPQSMFGRGFEPVILRWNSSVHLGHVSPYVELAGGGVWTQYNLPAGNTSTFNFTVRGGGGIRIMRGRRQAVEIGCRWSHISNANLGVNNPEFNGIQVSVGYHWFR
jgi:hypothetical protein